MAKTYSLQNQVINWKVKTAGGFHGGDAWSAEYYACLNDYGFIGYEGPDVTLTVNNDFSMWGSKTTQSNGTAYSFKNIRPGDMGPYLDYDIEIGTYYGETYGDFIFLTIYGENTDQSVSSTTVNKILNYPIQIYYGEDDGSGDSSSTPILSSNNTISLRYFEYTSDQRIGVDVFVNNGTNSFNTSYGSGDTDTYVTVYLFRSSSTEDLDHLDFEYPTNNQAFVDSCSLPAASGWEDVEFNFPKTDNSYYYFARACWRDSYNNINYYTNSQYLYIRSSSSYEPPEIYLSASINNSGIVTTSFSYDYEDTLNVTSYVYTLEDCTNGEERVERRTLTTPTCNFLSKMIPGREYYVSVVVNYSYFDFATSTTKNSSAETYTSRLEYKKYNKSLKAIFTDIVDAAQDVYSNNLYTWSSKRTLPVVVKNLNNLDTARVMKNIPSDISTNYDSCISTLAEIIRRRNDSVSGKLHIQDMPAAIRGFASAMKDRDYLLGNYIDKYTTSDYSSYDNDYHFSNLTNNVRPGDVLYLNIEGGSTETAIVRQVPFVEYDSSYDEGVRDGNKFEAHFPSLQITSKRYYDTYVPVISAVGTVTNNKLKYAIYNNTESTYTTTDVSIDLYAEDEDNLYCRAYFYASSDEGCILPTSVDIRVDYVARDAESKNGSIRLQGSLIREDANSGYIEKREYEYHIGQYDVVMQYYSGTITGTFDGTSKSVPVTGAFPL